MEGVGWLSVPWVEGRKKKRGGGQLHMAHPSGTVLPHKKSSELGGVDVDDKGGARCRRADVRICVCVGGVTR